MNIEIKVAEARSNMTQTQSQVIRRTANVMIEHGFTVLIKWQDGEESVMPTIRNHPLRSVITHY
jgi:hypothetical protein